MATIINNSLFAEETGNLIQNAIYYVPDPERVIWPSCRR